MMVSLALSPPHCLGSSFYKLIKLLGAGGAFLCPPIKLISKLSVESGKVNPVSGFCSASLFNGPRTIVVSIVRHGGKTSLTDVRSGHETG